MGQCRRHASGPKVLIDSLASTAAKKGCTRDRSDSEDTGCPFLQMVSLRTRSSGPLSSQFPRVFCHLCLWQDLGTASPRGRLINLSGEYNREKQDLINAWGGSVCRMNGFSRSAVLTGSTCIFLSLFPFSYEPLLKVSRNPLQKKVHKSCHMKMKKPRRVQ